MASHASKSDFFSRVLNDVEKYNEKRAAMRASIVERLLVRSLSPEVMHPNPDDEFTHDDVGPSDRIIEGYRAAVRKAIRNDERIYEEPIMVQKMQPEGYMILNGHHRWAAALKENVKKVRVIICNPRRS